MAKSFGEILREAREAKGLTTSQVAARTHILLKTIENLEEENFSKIPAPIYGRGFVRLYCECVGIDSRPLIEEYMKIHSGEKTPLYLRKKAGAAEIPESLYSNDTSVFSTHDEKPLPPIIENPVESAQENTSSSENEKKEEIPSSVSGLELFDQPEKINPFGEVKSKYRVPETRPEDPFFDDASPYVSNSNLHTHPQSTVNVAERFKNGINVFSDEIIKTVHKIPRRTWRIFALAGAVILIVFFTGWVISKLYQVTSSPSVDEPPAQIQGTQKPAARETALPQNGIPAKPRGKLKSSGIDVPSLYVD